jgi:phosphate:Na+ symporter
MTFVQTLGVILGADIGTTVTAQLIAFRLTDVALLIMAVGFLIRFVSKADRIRSIGDFLLGFGMLFFGM